MTKFVTSDLCIASLKLFDCKNLQSTFSAAPGATHTNETMSTDTQIEPKELDFLESKFIAAYFKLNGNGTQAYLTASPGTTVDSAKSLASRMLQRPHVAEIVKRKQAELVNGINKNTLVQDARRVSSKAEDAEQYSAALKGIELQGRFIGAFDDNEDNAEKYSNFIQIVSVKNTTVNIGENTKVCEGQLQNRAVIEGECG